MLEIDHGFTDVYYNLGKTLYELGKKSIDTGAIEEGWNKLKEAKIQLEKYLETEPNDSDALELLKTIETLQKELQTKNTG